MGEIINLRRARKAVAKGRAESLAAQNRIDFGLTKQEKAAALQGRQEAARQLDAHHIMREADQKEDKK
jgi:hypothetical protein